MTTNENFLRNHDNRKETQENNDERVTGPAAEEQAVT